MLYYLYRIKNIKQSVVSHFVRTLKSALLYIAMTT